MSLLLASRFKSSIADPVTKLINAAQKVSASQNYTLRIPHERTDELGTLIDSFNDMLAQIEGRGAALTHHRDELERQVSVRTEQLEKAKNAAEAASRAKSAFLATMSHEIRTPMNGVLGMTEMLLGTNLSDIQRKFTKLVKSSGEHLLVIINDILDFSKIEAGKLSVEYINFNLWDLLDDINNVYTPQAQAQGASGSISTSPTTSRSSICGDPNRLRQIMANLLGNAIKFTDQRPHPGQGPGHAAKTRSRWRCASRCTTPASASRARRAAASSRRSRRPTARPRASTAAPASAWRSRSSWSS